MKTKVRWSILIIILFALAGLTDGFASAQSPGFARFFAETGHWVTNEFLEKYNSVPNGEELFGLPITDAFIDETSNLTVQYFEKTRLELHPEAPPDLRVQISPLGEYLYTPGERISIPTNFPSCRSFAETGHQVCFAFLAFFEENGGIPQFGYPISNLEFHDGWITQYFQRARFEWHPELPIGERVTLADLGGRFFQFQGEDPTLLQPNFHKDDIPQQRVTELQLRTFVSEPIMPLAGRQQIYVIVHDQNFFPLENVIISFVVTLPGRKTIEGRMPETDIDGISRWTINVNSSTAGTATIIVTATFSTFQKQTRTSFQLW